MRMGQLQKVLWWGLNIKRQRSGLYQSAGGSSGEGMMGDWGW